MPACGPLLRPTATSRPLLHLRRSSARPTCPTAPARSPLTPPRPPAADWDRSQEEPASAQLWEQDWDDDDMGDDFAVRLKQELTRQAAGQQQGGQ